MRKAILWMLAMILLVSTVQAGTLEIKGLNDSTFRQSQAATLWIYVYNSSKIRLTNSSADCNIEVYNITHARMIASTMNFDSTSNAFTYSLTANNLGFLGDHSFQVYCNSSTETGFLIGIIEVTKDGLAWQTPSSFIAVMMILPLILSIIALIGAATLGEEHNAFRIFLFLFSMIPFFASMHMGLISTVKFYDFPVLENFIGSTAYWVSLIFYVIISYFIIYLFYVLVKASRVKKRERLDY